MPQEGELRKVPPPRELEHVNRITPLTGPEQELVAGWSAPDSWRPGARHPGRGKYLIKTGGRLGIAFHCTLADEEPRLYDTDQARRPHPAASAEVWKMLWPRIPARSTTVRKPTWHPAT
jgi:hypothetical protein